MSLANPNEKSWLSIYLKMSRTNSKTANESLQPENVRIFHNFSEYVNLLDPFRKNLRTGGPLDKYFRYPSEEEYFKDIIESDIWQEDNIFVEQRLAGLNPMVLKKLRLREYLEKRPNLNPELDNAIAKAAGQKTNMLQMVKKGLVYMIEYPLLRNLTNVPDIIERHPKDGRKMRHSISPLAFFLSVQNCVTKTYELKPVAIQMDFLASSPVFSPVDGSKWTLAKQEVQLADVTHSQIIEHLLKTHLLMERICVTVKRTLSEFHPLHQIFMWHCRGTLTVNGLGLPNLLDEYQFMHRLFAIGNIGAIELTNKGYKESSWADTEFEENLKKRGVDDTEKLPYFPYRDDGMIMWRLIKGFATEYVDLYAVITNITMLKYFLGILSFLSTDLNKLRYCFVRKRAGCNAESKEPLLRLIHTCEISTSVRVSASPVPFTHVKQAQEKMVYASV